MISHDTVTSRPESEGMARGRDLRADLQETDEEARTERLYLSPPKTRALPFRPKPADLLRPDLTPRRSTDPTMAHSTTFQGYFGTNSNQTRPHTSHGRNRSPFSRSHLRSKSSGASLAGGPVLTRARSMPNHFPRTSLDNLSSWSPATLATPPRVPSPLRMPVEEFGVGVAAPMQHTTFWSEGFGGNAVETIEEDSELDTTPRAILSPPHLSTASASFGRSASLRRRPTSPLHSVKGISTPTHTAVPNSSAPAGEIQGVGPYASAATSLSSTPQKYNEAYPSLHHYASSSSFGSFPSTPTSQRSRSPSISSLDTIEDTPDLEYQALEDDRIESLKLAAERQERQERGEIEEDPGGRRRGSFDMPRGFGRGTSRERKRWSVCGAERRADLDLETIWED